MHPPGPGVAVGGRRSRRGAGSPVDHGRDRWRRRPLRPGPPHDHGVAEGQEAVALGERGGVELAAMPDRRRPPPAGAGSTSAGGSWSPGRRPPGTGSRRGCTGRCDPTAPRWPPPIRGPGPRWCRRRPPARPPAQAATVSAGPSSAREWMTWASAVAAVTGRKVSSPMARSTRASRAPASRQRVEQVRGEVQPGRGGGGRAVDQVRGRRSRRSGSAPGPRAGRWMYGGSGIEPARSTTEGSSRRTRRVPAPSGSGSTGPPPRRPAVRAARPRRSPSARAGASRGSRRPGSAPAPPTRSPRRPRRPEPAPPAGPRPGHRSPWPGPAGRPAPGCR